MLPHGVKETQCADCRQPCFKNNLSGHKVKLHTRNDPAFVPTGPGNRLEVMATPVYSLHRCSDKAPVLITTTLDASAEQAAASALHRLAAECGIQGLADKELEESHELLSSIFRDCQQELAELRRGEGMVEKDDTIETLTASLKRETLARQALEKQLAARPHGDDVLAGPDAPPEVQAAAAEQPELELEPVPPGTSPQQYVRDAGVKLGRKAGKKAAKS